ncbi:MAG: tetratricopeptide repeat protein [Candidatus Rifleibacteriota bacterium]
MSGDPDLFGHQFKEEEFFTDAQVDFDTSFEDALILEKYEVARRQLDDFKSRYGETASYLHRLGRLKEKQGKTKEAYEIFKKLFYEVPVFMRDKNELEKIQREVIQETISKAKAQWNQIVARASRFLEENPEDHGKENAQPYVRVFWDKHLSDIEAVAQSFLSILELEEHEVQAIMGLIQCYSELNLKEKTSFYKTRATEAKKYWKAMVQRRTDAVINAAKKQEDSNNFDNVITVVNLGLATDPPNADLLTMKADALQKLGHYQDALACVYVVLRERPNDTKALRLKKTIEAQQFEYNLKQGLDYLFRAEQEKPNSPAQAQRIETALSFFLDALTFDAQNLSALAGVYRCHIRSGQPLKAQKTLERIREIDSSFDVYSIFRDKSENKGDGEGCFVATRLYGERHPVTEVLRQFRRQYLLNNLPGQAFVRLYKRIGPALAELPGRGPLFAIFRTLIELLVDKLLKSRLL